MNTLSSFDWCEGANDWVDVEMGNFSTNSSDEQEPSHENDLFINKMDELEVNEMSFKIKSSNRETNHNSCFFTATAELDEDQGDPVTVETPTRAQENLAAIFQQVKQLPKVPPESLEFSSFFISVSEEKLEKQTDISNSEYGTHEVLVDAQSNVQIQKQISSAFANNDESSEKYEKVLPPHGDKLFHNLITRIQRNPGQLLRYIREDGAPLFLYPVKDELKTCQNCGGDLVYELQLLPTLISRLQLVGSGSGHIEYGTVFVLACKKSCWTPNDVVRTEYVLVQREV